MYIYIYGNEKNVYNMCIYIYSRQPYAVVWVGGLPFWKKYVFYIKKTIKI